MPAEPAMILSLLSLVLPCLLFHQHPSLPQLTQDIQLNLQQQSQFLGGLAQRPCPHLSVSDTSGHTLSLSGLLGGLTF